jgi:hypothetical protein
MMYASGCPAIGSAIGGDRPSSVGNLSIFGGNIRTAGNYYGPAIGSSPGEDGLSTIDNLRIFGGNVTVNEPGTGGDQSIGGA